MSWVRPCRFLTVRRGTARELKRRLLEADALRESGQKGAIEWLSSSSDPNYVERAKMLYAL